MSAAYGRLHELSPWTAAICSAAALTLVACGDDDDPSSADPGLPQGGEHVELDPADFTTEIDNP